MTTVRVRQELVGSARHPIGDKTQMASALPQTLNWSPDLFRPTSGSDPGAEEYAYECVSELVGRSMSMGSPRREYSLASKVLHWLLPWRVPVYDNFVRGSPVSRLRGITPGHTGRSRAIPSPWPASRARTPPGSAHLSPGQLSARLTNAPGGCAAVTAAPPHRFVIPGVSCVSSDLSATDAAVAAWRRRTRVPGPPAGTTGTCQWPPGILCLWC